MTEGLRIIAMRAENFKRLSVVHITPKGAIVEIAGKNGMGKTSVLDAIVAALDRANLKQSKLLKGGADKAVIELMLGSGDVVKYQVTRTFTANGGEYLKVETPDGMVARAGQTLLDELIGALSFDPIEFMRLKDSAKFELLRGLVKIEVDLDALDKERADTFASRTEVNRDLQKAKAVAAAIIVLKDAPDKPVAVDEIIGELAGVDSFNAEIRTKRAAIAQLEGLRIQLVRSIDAQKSRIAEMQASLATQEQNLVEAERLLSNHAANPPAELRDADAIRVRVVAAQAANAAYQRRIERWTADETVEALQKEATALTETLDGYDAAKRNAIASAKMPIEGLALVEGGVTYKGIPLNQASDAEQLLVSTTIAAALNPKLRVIRMRDGSLLDSESMATLATFAEQNDLQIWVERVDENGKSGIIMENGHIRGQEELVAAHDAKAAAAAPPPTGEEFDARVYLDYQMRVLAASGLEAINAVDPVIRAKLKKLDVANGTIFGRAWNTFYLTRRRELEKVKA